MADLHEILITAELPAGLEEHEMAELRWHLGLGPQPEKLTIVTDSWEVTCTDDEGEPLPEEHWETIRFPLLARRGPSDPRIGGIDFSEMARREGPDGPGWALSSRQVCHSDDLPLLGQLFRWLRERAVGHRADPARFSCHTRFYEDPVLEPASLDGEEWAVS